MDIEIEETLDGFTVYSEAEGLEFEDDFEDLEEAEHFASTL